MIPRFACCLLLVFGCLSTCGLYGAEGPEKPDPDRFGQPLLRVWFPSTIVEDQQRLIAEVLNDSEQILQHAVATAKIPASAPGITREGLLVFHDPDGYIPENTVDVGNRRFPGHLWLKPVRFMKVGNREAFEKEVRRRTGTDQGTAWGGGVLKEMKSGYIFGSNVQWIELGMRSKLESYLTQISAYWTYRDGYMFFGDFEEILEMDFPDPRTLSPKGTDADRDIFVQVDLNAVLPRQKRILWNLIRKEFERSLQQSDEEGDAEYAFRKSVGDLQLNLIQAVTQDLESIRLGIDFASEEKPAKAELELVARPRVNLEHYFGTSGIGTPALAAFVEEPAAMTLATSWGLPERIVQTLEKLQLVVDAKLAEQRGWTVDAILASEELTQDLRETIRGNNQIAVKLKQTEHGFTLYGGMRVQNAERVSKNLAMVLQGLTGRDGWGVLQSRDDSGRKYFSFRPEDLTQAVTNRQGKRFPAELHFTVVDEILWFSVGRQDSLDNLSASLDRIEENETQPVKSSIPLALFDMSLDGMFPDKDLNDTEGFDRLPLAMVEKLDSLIPRKGGSPWQHDWVTLSNVSDFNVHASREVRIAGNASNVEEKKAPVIKWNPIVANKSDSIDRVAETVEERIRLISPSIDFADSTAVNYHLKIAAPDLMKMQKFLQPDQSRVRIQFDADEKRVRARATVGLGVIKHIYSRMMETENTRFNRIFIDLSDTLLESGEVDLQFTVPELPGAP